MYYIHILTVGFLYHPPQHGFSVQPFSPFMVCVLPLLALFWLVKQQASVPTGSDQTVEAKPSGMFRTLGSAWFVVAVLLIAWVSGLMRELLAHLGG